MVVGPWEICRELDRVGSLLTGAYPNHAIYLHDPHLAVTNSVGARCAHNRIDNSIDDVIVGKNLDTYLWHEVDRVLGTSVHLNVSALAAEPARLGDGETVDPDIRECFLNFFKLERLDDRGYELH